MLLEQGVHFLVKLATGRRPTNKGTTVDWCAPLPVRCAPGPPPLPRAFIARPPRHL